MTEGGKDAIVLTVAEDVEVATGTVRHRAAQQRMSAFSEEPRGGRGGADLGGRSGRGPRFPSGHGGQHQRRRTGTLSTTLSAKGERTKGLSNLELQGGLKFCRL
nr:hypothetical protein Itr_chr10CG12590 [Ipomoea trifida]